MDLEPVNPMLEPAAADTTAQLANPTVQATYIHLEPAKPASTSVRKLELLLLLTIAIGPYLFNALYVYWYGISEQDLSYVRVRLASGIIHEMSSLALLIYILFRQGRALRNIGLSFRWLDIPVSVALFVLAYIAHYLCYLNIYYLHYFWTQRRLEPWNNISSILGTHASVAAILFILINPFFEELIARAYVMSEITALTKSVYVAGIVSVGMQALYHLYQGVPNALSVAALFTVFSLYYGKSRRILPVILAHLYLDAIGTAYLYFRHH